MNDNLPELRDIHLPDGVSFFPLAYGWYIIPLCAIAIYCLYKAYKIWKKRSRKIYAQNIIFGLDNENIITSATTISELLRRVCIYRYPEAVALEGDSWIKFLCSKTKVKLSHQGAELLKNAPYMNLKDHSYSVKEMQELKDFALFWIGENL